MKMLHKPNFEVAMQMAKKFVSKEDVRPILQMAYLADDGSFAATDSRKLLYVKDVHGFRSTGADNIVCEGGLLMNPKTLEMAEQKGGQMFPNLENIIKPHAKDGIRLTLAQVKVWHQAHKSMKQMHDVLGIDDYNYPVKLNIDFELTNSIGAKNTITLVLDQQGHKVTMNLPFTKSDYNELERIPFVAYNAQIMADCLEAMVKFKANEVGIRFGTSYMAPIQMWSDDEQVMAMVVPIRTYGGDECATEKQGDKP
jgi:hypothetical protein